MGNLILVPYVLYLSAVRDTARGRVVRRQRVVKIKKATWCCVFSYISPLML